MAQAAAAEMLCVLVAGARPDECPATRVCESILGVWVGRAVGGAGVILLLGVDKMGLFRVGDWREEKGAIKGAQHGGTGRGLGGNIGSRDRGKRRRLAARIRAAVVNVIANATANRS